MSGKGAILAAAVVTAVSAGPALAAWPYDSIVSFGDSLSDVGNVFLATGGVAPASPYYAGRFSNGPIWLDNLAQAMHLSPLVPRLAGGTDYAFGGATTGSAATNNPAVPNFATQVAWFLQDAGGVAPSDALYTVSIGANDLFAAIANAATPAEAFAQAESAAQAAADAADLLKGAGATDLVVFDVPDLSKTPAALTEAAGMSAPDAAQFLGFVQALSADYDAHLFADLASLAEGSDFKYYDLNVFGLIDSAVATPSDYGFTNVTERCYVGDYTGGGSVCGSPDTYLFWDDKHPAVLAGRYIAEDALALVAPEPSSWAMLAIGFAGIGLAGLGRRRETQAA